MNVENIKKKALTLSKAVNTERVTDVFDEVMEDVALSAPDYIVITRLADVYHQVQSGGLSREEGTLKQRELIEEWNKAIK